MTEETGAGSVIWMEFSNSAQLSQYVDLSKLTAAQVYDLNQVRRLFG